MRADTTVTATTSETTSANHWADFGASRPPFSIEQAYYRYIAHRLRDPGQREIFRRVSAV